MITRKRNLFRITRFIILKLPLLFRFFSKFRARQKRLLIIKNDAIGDYVLFRNFIGILAATPEYHDYRIDLLGNSLWAELASKYDRDNVSKFYFVNPDQLYESPLRVLALGWRLFSNRYEVVLQPTYARTFINDGLGALAAAPMMVGFEGDTERISLKYKRKTDRFYKQLFQIPAGCLFEFDRTKFFFETFLKQRLDINRPQLPVQDAVDRTGIVIFPGAGVSKRCWELSKFATLIKLILENSSQNIILAGGANDAPLCDLLIKSVDSAGVVSRAGKTSLPELVELIGTSTLVLANETSAVHIAVATSTPSVCILGGGHFGRFTPYPEKTQYAPMCVFEKMDCFNCNWQCIYKIDNGEPFPCISTIEEGPVWHAVRQFL